DVSRIMLQLQRYFSELLQTPMTLGQIAERSPQLAAAIRQLQIKAYSAKADGRSQSENTPTSSTNINSVNSHLSAECAALLKAVKAGGYKPSIPQSAPLSPLNPQ
ncbi:MAG: BatD family protein, partial [Shewanella sp.]